MLEHGLKVDPFVLLDCFVEHTGSDAARQRQALLLGRIVGADRAGASAIEQAPFNVAILAALFIVTSALMSLVARERSCPESQSSWKPTSSRCSCA